MIAIKSTYKIEYQTYKMKNVREFVYTHAKSTFDENPRQTTQNDLRLIFGSLVMENCEVFAGKPISIKLKVLSINREIDYDYLGIEI